MEMLGILMAACEKTKYFCESSEKSKHLCSIYDPIKKYRKFPTH